MTITKQPETEQTFERTKIFGRIIFLTNQVNSGKFKKQFVQPFNFFGSGNFPSLICSFSSNSLFLSSAESASLSVAFSHKLSYSAFRFTLLPSLSWYTSRTNNYLTHLPWILRNLHQKSCFLSKRLYVFFKTFALSLVCMPKFHYQSPNSCQLGNGLLKSC